ncbi:MAG: methionine biosynthesis protein MetW, partial [Planctomycetota bacterium]
MLAHITYLSRDGMTAKFDPVRDKPRDVDSDFEKLYGVGTYLAHQGDKFVERFDANSYITITRAEDQFDLGEGGDALAERFAMDTHPDTRFGIISFSSDWLFPPEQSRQIVEGLCKAGRRTSYIEVTSDAGHDAFLLPNEVDQYGGFIRAMLEGEATTTTPTASDVSVFAAHRLDYDAMLELIPPGSRVLDLGCGDGGLLARLKQRGDKHLLGIDVQTANVLAAVGRGLDVIDADLNQPLRFFADSQFDVVVLSQTLQSVESTLGVLGELMRVGRHAVVSFPNFGYGPLREMLYRDGRSPKAGGYDHEWYDSPNRRFPTILDFRELCQHLGLRIERHRYLDTSSGRVIDDEAQANRDADLAVVLLEAERAPRSAS